MATELLHVFLLKHLFCLYFQFNKIRGHLKKWVSCNTWRYQSHVTRAFLLGSSLQDDTFAHILFDISKFSFSCVKTRRLGCGVIVIILSG